MDGIAAECEYLVQRMAIILHLLGQVEGLVPAAHARVVRAEADSPESNHRQRLRRELRILRQLRERVPEGSVLRAAELWRHSLGIRLYDHRQKHLQEQDAHDSWSQLPSRLRERTPEPLKPPELWVTDRVGEKWLIDDRFLLALDDVIAKLRKWRASAA